MHFHYEENTQSTQSSGTQVKYKLTNPYFKKEQTKTPTQFKVLSKQFAYQSLTEDYRDRYLRRPTETILSKHDVWELTIKIVPQNGQGIGRKCLTQTQEHSYIMNLGIPRRTRTQKARKKTGSAVVKFNSIRQQRLGKDWRRLELPLNDHSFQQKNINMYKCVA